LKFKQSHYLSDVRLAIGYAAFLISAATFAWDYQFGFESTKYYTAAAVLLYTCLNGALTYWQWFIEKGKIYVGTSANGDRVCGYISYTLHSTFMFKEKRAGAEACIQVKTDTIGLADAIITANKSYLANRSKSPAPQLNTSQSTT